MKLEQLNMKSINEGLLDRWINELEFNLANKLNVVKKDHFEFFERNENIDYLNNLALELEQYINEHTMSIEKIMSQFSDIEDLNKINTFTKDLYDPSINISSESFFENKLIKFKLDNVASIYEYYIEKFKKQNDKIVSQLKHEYNIYNY
jgi:hypothetical protein